MFSIVICTYNRDKFIYDALKCIAENRFQRDKYEVLLVDNSSTDNTAGECYRFQQDYPDIPYCYFVETNQGLSHARNRGIAEAQGDMLIFLDDDSFIAPDYLKNLEKNVGSTPDLAAFGGRITPLFESGKPPRWLSKWTMSWVSAIHLSEEATLFKGDKYPIGANMGISKKWLEKIGTFNTALGRSKKNLMAGEEKDLFSRIKKRNGSIFYFPDVQVRHVIPDARTSKEYIRKMAQGVGKSEKLRTLEISKQAYLSRLFLEAVKWAASFVLFFGYSFRFTPYKGSILLFFRWNVTKGLLEK